MSQIVAFIFTPAFLLKGKDDNKTGANIGHDMTEVVDDGVSSQ